MSAPSVRSLFDPRISLAMSVHAQPGVYALLAGSGTSTGAGIPTGWGVIKDLVKRAAAAHDTPFEGEPSDADVEAWWSEHGDGEDLGYSGLLESLGPNQAARSALIRDYFEPTAEEREAGEKVPGAAHRAIAELVRRGSLRVIVTTNFDSLLEQALDAVSVPYQVLSTEADVEGRSPLVHAGCTVLKIHGDYRSLSQRNTLAELSKYPPAVESLLEEVFENYGLVVNGWSGDWDKALVATLNGRRTRRYPFFWSALHPLGASARAVAVQQSATIIDGYTADEFFPDLVHRLEALDRLAAPPMSEELAVARLKKLLPYRESYIELRDLLEGEIDKVSDVIARHGQMIPNPENGQTQAGVCDDELAKLRDASRTLVRLAAVGIMLDRDRVHAELWPWVIQRLLRARPPVNGAFQDLWVNLSHYPAILVLRAITMVAVAYAREDVLIRVLTEPKWRGQFDQKDHAPAFRALQDFEVVDALLARELPRWKGTNRHRYPIAQLLDDDMRTVIYDLFDSDEDFNTSFRRAEYRMALADTVLPGKILNPSPGLYTGDFQWSKDGLVWEEDFRLNGDREAWGWKPVPDGQDDPFHAKLTELSETIKPGSMGIGW